MSDDLKIGISFLQTITVQEKDTAHVLKSGDLFVLATPVMIRFMEECSLLAVSKCLGEGYTTVGTKVDIKHVAATPMGMEIKIKSTLIEIDGKRLVFNVEVSDRVEIVGFGIHERFIINSKKFMEKVNAKNLA